MNKFLKAFKYACIVLVIINILWFVLVISHGGLENFVNKYKEVLPIPLTLCFAPTFLAIYFFNSKSLFKSILKSALLSFLLVYVVVYLTLIYFTKREGGISFWNIPSFFNSIVAILLVVFSTLIYYVTTNKLAKDTDYKQVKLSIKEVGLIWGIISVLCLIVASILNKKVIPIDFILIHALLGIIACVMVFFGAKYIIKHHFKKNNKIVVGGVYFVNIFLLPSSINIFIWLLTKLSYNNSDYLKPPTMLVTIIRALILYGSYFLLLTLTIHIYLIFKLNKAQKQNLKQIGVTASLKYQQLKAQLSPHFLFNNISVLTGLIEENQQRAIVFSEKLSNVYRYFLDYENQDLILLKDEVVFIEKYLALLQVRFENALTYTCDTNNLNEYYILPMTLQQVLENVIKHNEISIEKPINIQIDISDDCLVVTNNLNPKLGKENNKSLGLENIENRYTFFTDKKIIIMKEDKHFTIKLPLLKIEA